ncbi:dipeptidase [Shivajiella indica]|uniref:Dipeptidase n=1 Tax=Shivajiella indica TaxID=872115 RepID=A0ABW5BF79_9BACT
MQIPIIDTHCDILSYLAKIPKAEADKVEDIACAIPLLQKGNVKMQVCAIYTDVKPGSMDLAIRQAFKFREMLMTYPKEVVQADAEFLSGMNLNSKIGLVTAIENAAGLAEEKVPIKEAFHQLDHLIKLTGRMAYISLTHHTENRFGGGNYTEGIGLKDDGKKLLDYISGKKIAIDLSHTSDLLAEGILNHIEKQKLDIPVIASHSNFRKLWNHKRNLSDEFAKEVIKRGGIIGINFLRAFLDNEKPERIFEHILYGFEIGAEEQMCFGADFFYTKDFPDPSRHPFYFPIVENASKYPAILEKLAENLSIAQLEKLAYKNAQRFFKALWA